MSNWTTIQPSDLRRHTSTPRAICGGCRGAGWRYPVTMLAGRRGLVECASCHRTNLECNCAFVPTLFETVPPVEPDSIEGKFRTFHRENPHVYVALCRLAREYQHAGHDKGSIAMLFEVLRWQTDLTTRGDKFLLNNSWRSRYARLIANLEDDLDGFFETRELSAP